MAGDIIYKVSSAVLTVFLLVAAASAQDAMEKDVKLLGGSHKFQGLLSVYNASQEQQWRLVCPETWSRAASDLVCKKLGLFGKAMVEKSDKPFIDEDKPNRVVGVGCNTTDTAWEDCTFYPMDCATDTAVKIECALPNYVGCFPDSEDMRALEGSVFAELEGVTIDGCMSSCREEGFAYAGLVSPKTCLCGSAGENLEKKTKLSDDKCVDECSGEGLQACGKAGEAAAVYDVSVGNCGGRLKAKEGIVASPGFPENYSIDNPKVCQWVIDISENGDTIIDFPMFDLDPTSDDNLQISEDDGETWKKYTSSLLPDKIVTSEKILRLKFTIVSRNGGNIQPGASQGFLATFSDATACDDMDIINGTLEFKEDMEYGPGEKVKLLCDDGYLPNHKLVVCQSSGRWYPMPKCEEGRSIMPSLVFTTTLLYMMVTVVGVLGVIILSIIVAMMCIRSNKKSEGYKGISSGESGYQKGPDDIDEKDHKIEMQDGMQDDGMDMMHSNEQAIPLATAGVE